MTGIRALTLPLISARPVYASAAGTVEQAGWNGGYGRYVKLDHGNGYETGVRAYERHCRNGSEAVRKGDIIGFARQQRLQHRPAHPL